MSIEKQVQKLEEIANKLESDSIEIDEAMKLFEDGVTIVKNTKKELQDAVGKITVLRQDLDKLVEQDFVPTND